VHDFFEILGIPDNARACEVRRACARRIRRCHPDFRVPGTPVFEPVTSLQDAPVVRGEVAVDFVDASSFIDRLQTAFFADVN
jgi:hypothetical protein